MKDELEKCLENDAGKLWIEARLIPHIFENSKVKANTNGISLTVSKSLRPRDFYVKEYDIEETLTGYKVSALAVAIYDIPERLLTVSLDISSVVSNHISENTEIRFNLLG